MHVLENRLEAGLAFRQWLVEQTGLLDLADVIMADQLDRKLLGQARDDAVAADAALTQFGDQGGEHGLDFRMEQALFTQKGRRRRSEDVAGQVVEVVGLEKDRNETALLDPAGSTMAGVRFDDQQLAGAAFDDPLVNVEMGQDGKWDQEFVPFVSVFDRSGGADWIDCHPDFDGTAGQRNELVGRQDFGQR